jgi:hypothetical protein
MTELSTEEKPKHNFDKKYKIVIGVNPTASYLEMTDWINSNSNGPVDVRFNDNGVITHFAFVDVDDALIFKIKYSV